MAQHASTGEGLGQVSQSWEALNALIRNGHSFSGREMNCAFLNLGDGVFADVSHAAGFDSAQDSRGAARVDWDGDGDLDIWLTCRSGTRVRLLRNDATERGGHIAFRLEGTDCNRDAVGARVEVRTPTRVLKKTLATGTNFMAQGSKTLHFGLGDELVMGVVVHWPDGSISDIGPLESSATYRIVQHAGSAERLSTPAEASGSVLERLEYPPAEISSVASVPLAVPLELPDLTFTEFSGRTRRIREFLGRPVLVNLWASWCVPCAAELTAFAAERSRWESSGIDLIAISIDDAADLPQAEDLARSIGFWFPSGFASTDLHRLVGMLRPLVVERYESLPLPSSLLLDASGRVVRVYFGPCTLDQVEDDAAGLPSNPEDHARYVARGPGVWIAPDTVIKSAWWNRTIRLVNEFVQDDVPELALFYASQLHERRRVDEPPASLIARANAAMAEIVTALRDDDPDKAAEVARWIIASDPDNADALILLVDVLARIDTPAALAEGSRAFATFLAMRPTPTSAQDFATIGRTWAQLGDYSQAADSFERALEIDSTHLESLRGLGMSRDANEQYEDAIEPYTRYLEQQPNDSAVVDKLSTVHERLGHWAQAIERCRQLVDLAPDHLIARLRLAMMYATVPQAELRDGEEALRLAQQVEEAVGPASPILYDVYAAAYAELGLFEKAVDAAREGIRVATEHNSPIADGIRERLRLYEQGQPFRRD